MDRHASGNSFAKSVWVKGEPAFEASPRAGPQTSPSNTNANARPSETPLATARPSISRNQSSDNATTIASGPNVKRWGAKNKLVTRERAAELRAQLRE